MLLEHDSYLDSVPYLPFIFRRLLLTLRKHAYSNILKILQPKKENIQIKNSDIFHFSSKNIHFGYSLEPPRRGGSNEYPQSMLFSKIRKIMYTPVNPSFDVFDYIGMFFVMNRRPYWLTLASVSRKLDNSIIFTLL